MCQSLSRRSEPFWSLKSGPSDFGFPDTSQDFRDLRILVERHHVFARKTFYSLHSSVSNSSWWNSTATLWRNWNQQVKVLDGLMPVTEDGRRRTRKIKQTPEGRFLEQRHVGGVGGASHRQNPTNLESKEKNIAHLSEKKTCSRSEYIDFLLAHNFTGGSCSLFFLSFFYWQPVAT